MSSPRSGGTFRTIVLTSLAIGVLVAIGASMGWSLWKRPFATTVIDRSPPPVLTSLQAIAEFRAARANFEVIVDVEKDVEYIPSVLAGERVLFVGVGSVDSYVDFSTLGPDAVALSDDRTGVTITLPAPELSAPVVDPTQSRVVDTDKGLFDRLGDLVSGEDGDDQALYVAASDKMAAAADAAGLQAEAEANTRAMLEGLLTGLGFETITVNFTPTEVG